MLIRRRTAIFGLLFAGRGSVAFTFPGKTSNATVTPQQFLASSESLDTDAGPAIRRALATGKPVRFPPGTYVVDYDPASGFNDGGAARYSHCIAIPSGAIMTFDSGAIIKGKAGLRSWSRIVVAVNVSNFRIFGELKVDANVANCGTPSNEHMHGVFLFNATNFFIEAIDSRNARADNIYIGGTDNTRGTCDGSIGRVFADAAGRKNMVWQAFDGIRIDSATLNNTGGGAALFGGVADGTDGNCFDVEPDAFSGAVPNSGSIGYLKTSGAGNDFTAGVTAMHSNGMTISIGKWNNIIVPRSTTPWHAQNALTLNINEWVVRGVTETALAASIYYAARLNIGILDFKGATSGVAIAAFEISQVGGNRPEVRIGTANVTTTQGAGFEVKDGLLHIEYYNAQTAGLAFWARGRSSTAGLYTDVTIGQIELFNCGAPLGAGYAVLASKAGRNQTITRIGRLVHTDNRMPRNSFIVNAAPAACKGMSIGDVENRTPAVGLFQTSCPAN